MNGKDLFYGMNYVNENLVEEAERKMFLKTRKKTGRIFLIAALISVLGIAAFATTVPNSTNAWFFSFFGNDTTEVAEGELTENQSAILDTGLVEINQSVTCEGYTITLESGLCDGYKALIKCRVDAPEGVILNGMNYALICQSNIEVSGGLSGNYSGASYTGYLLEDEDPNDNSITQLLDIIVQPLKESSFSLANGCEWGFTFNEISELTGSGEDVTWSTLCEGKWEFKVKFDDELLVTESTELLNEPVKCLWSLHIRNKKIPVRAKVFSVELRSLTATIRYKRPWIAVFQGVYLDQPIYLVLNDGTKVLVEVKMTTYRDDYDETLCHFDRPVSVEDVAYIEFPGVGKVEVLEGRQPRWLAGALPALFLVLFLCPLVVDDLHLFGGDQLAVIFFCPIHAAL